MRFTLVFPLLAFALLAVSVQASDATTTLPKTRSSARDLAAGGAIILFLIFLVFALHTYLLGSGGALLAGAGLYQGLRDNASLTTSPTTILKQEDGFKMYVRLNGMKQVLVREYEGQDAKVKAELQAMHKIAPLRISAVQPSRYVSDDKEYLISEVVKGVKLGEFGQLSTHQAAWLLYQGAKALYDLHCEAGIAFGGSMKDAMIDLDGNIKLIDFTQAFELTGDNSKKATAADLQSLVRVIHSQWYLKGSKEVLYVPKPETDDERLLSLLVDYSNFTPKQLMQMLKAQFRPLSPADTVHTVRYLLELK